MALSFELVQVEYDFPMLEMRSCDILEGDRHITICAYQVGLIRMPTIVRHVTEVRFRKPHIWEYVRYHGTDSDLKHHYVFEFLNDNRRLGGFACNSVSAVSAPTFKYPRMTFNLDTIKTMKDVESLFSWGKETRGRFEFGQVN